MVSYSPPDTNIMVILLLMVIIWRLDDEGEEEKERWLTNLWLALLQVKIPQVYAVCWACWALEKLADVILQQYQQNTNFSFNWIWKHEVCAHIFWHLYPQDKKDAFNLPDQEIHRQLWPPFHCQVQGGLRDRLQLRRIIAVAAMFQVWLTNYLPHYWLWHFYIILNSTSYFLVILHLISICKMTPKTQPNLDQIQLFLQTLLNNCLYLRNCHLYYTQYGL